jgi:hypothetical protein
MPNFLHGVKIWGGFAPVAVQFEKEASQTRDYCVAQNATQRAARPDPSLGNKLLDSPTSF